MDLNIEQLLVQLIQEVSVLKEQVKQLTDANTKVLKIDVEIAELKEQMKQIFNVAEKAIHECDVEDGKRDIRIGEISNKLSDTCINCGLQHQKIQEKFKFLWTAIIILTIATAPQVYKFIVGLWK